MITRSAWSGQVQNSAPSVEELIKNIAESLGTWAYLLVAFMAAAETAAFLGFIAPGEFTIILGGVLAGEGSLSIGILIGVVWVSIVIGDSIGFTLGRKLGREFAHKHGPRVRLTEERLNKVEDYFGRHGGKTVFFGRWIGFVRPLMPFTAGASGMPYRRFIPYDVLSAGLFGATFTLLGYIFYHSLGTITTIAGRGAIGVGIIAAVVVAGVFTFKRLRSPEGRQRAADWFRRQGERPALRPLVRAGAVVGRPIWRYVGRPIWRYLLAPIWRYALRPIARTLGPPLRFLGHRLTPGELGIELTTLVAIAAVSGYVFGIYTDVVGDGGLTPADHTALDAARDIRVAGVTTLAKVITVLGSIPAVTVAVVVAGALLVLRRRYAETVVLAGGAIAIHFAVQIAKDAVERPRPGDGLVDAEGFGFPSGHAAMSITYVAIAVALSRIPRHAGARVTMVAAGVVVAAAVGLSRVYLQVHYLSDVTAGWALGLAIFSLLGSIALVVSYVRNNERAGHRPKPRDQLSAASDG